MEPILEMIKTLTGINSPSGDTEEAIQFVEKYAKDLGYQTTLTNKGALLITVPGKNDEVQRCITAHVDTLGAMVKEIKEEQIILPHTTQFYISNNEEIGYGANASIDSKIKEYIALDMGALGDGQASDEYTVSICAKDASGPYHKQLKSHLVNLCKINNIPYKVDIYPYYGSDASAALHAGADIRHGLFGAGIESSHAMERTHIDSIKATEKLLYAYCLSPIE
ncbi:TPA: hypothetical protein O4W55_002053 [Staphylococcus aureus]|nr:hypothetical protein [Staphylococcus aureus]